MKTVVYGNGSVARLLYAYARDNLQLAGFTVDDACIAPDMAELYGLPLIPFSQVERQFPPADHQMIIAVGYIEMNGLREHKYREASELGYSFGRYVDPTVRLHDDVSIGENCIILDHVSIHPGSTVGHSVFISSNVNIGHDCRIGAYSWINSGVAIAGWTEVGERAFLGINASIGDSVRLGRRNYIAANTLVARNTEDDAVYISEPGQKFRLKSLSFLRFARIFDA
jgi:sugar O-acyltransferase (sialic acid O-acetyltransferase NeuD family)